jgi:hypothetical protein
MNKKFTIDTIKDLKVKVKEMNGIHLSYYTRNEFKPDDSFRLFTEQTEASVIGEEAVTRMITSINKIDNSTSNEF